MYHPRINHLMSVSLSVELKDKFVKGHMINQGGKYYSMKNREKYK